MNAMTQTSCGSSCGCSAGDVGTATAEPVVTGFAIANMDCPSEEAQIRKRLAQVDGIRGMVFDLAGRRLEVTHEPAGQNAILRALHDIGMQAVVAPASQQVVYFIEEMDCPSEERQLRSVLEPLEGVQAVDFDLKAHTLTVSHSLADTASIARTIEGLGMRPFEKAEGSAAPVAGEPVPVVASHAPLQRLQQEAPRASSFPTWTVRRKKPRFASASARSTASSGWIST